MCAEPCPCVQRDHRSLPPSSFVSLPFTLFAFFARPLRPPPFALLASPLPNPVTYKAAWSSHVAVRQMRSTLSSLETANSAPSPLSALARMRSCGADGIDT